MTQNHDFRITSHIFDTETFIFVFQTFTWWFFILLKVFSSNFCIMRKGLNWFAMLTSYRKYPNLVRTQVETISDPNYLVRIFCEFKAPNSVLTSLLFRKFRRRKINLIALNISAHLKLFFLFLRTGILPKIFGWNLKSIRNRPLIDIISIIISYRPEKHIV